MLKFKYATLGLLTLIKNTQGSTATSKPAALSTQYSNSSKSATASGCCFVVLDTIYENYWADYATSTIYSPANLTSITTLITPYPNVTHTNYETNVYITSIASYTIFDAASNPVSLYNNDVPGPVEEGGLKGLNSYVSVGESLTVVTTGGLTINSPQAFWAYPTVRIITADAVTDSSGHKVCGTTVDYGSSVFTNVVLSTSYLDFSYPITSRVGWTDTDTDDISKTGEVHTYDPVYSTVGYSYTSYPSYVTLGTSGLTTLIEAPTPILQNSNVGSYFYPNNTKTGVVISFTTPFIYAPTQGATYVTHDFGDWAKCASGTDLGGWGYPVQTLLDFLVQNPTYSAQYPGLENCLPGGPILPHVHECSAASPEVENPAGDLTSHTIIIVTPTGAPPKSVAQPASTANPSSATKTTHTEPSTTTSPPPKLESETRSVVSSNVVVSIAPPSSSPSTIHKTDSDSIVIPSHQPASSHSVQEQPSSTTASAASTAIPPLPQISQAATTPSPTGSSLSLAQPPASSEIPSPLSPTSSVAFGSIIASIIGASSISVVPTVISGTSDVIVSGVATIPVPSQSVTPVGSAETPPLSGSTIVISGVTNVIVSFATTISLSPLLASLPEAMTLVSGTLNVVISTPTTIPLNSNVPGLSGSTFVSVVSGITESFVAVSIPQTVPVVLGIPTSGPSQVGGGANQTAPIQVTSAGSTPSYNFLVPLFGSIVCGALILVTGMAF